MLKHVFTGCVLLNAISMAIIWLLQIGDSSAFPGSALYSIGKAWEAIGPGLLFIALICSGVIAGFWLFGQKQIVKWHPFH